MRGYRTPYLAIIQKQYVRAREASRRGDTKQRIREAVQVAYVAAKGASQDPRAVAIASTAAVALAMAWVAYSTHDPVSDDDVRTALKYAYMPRRFTRLVRHFTGSGKDMRAYLAEGDACVPAYALLHKLQPKPTKDAHAMPAAVAPASSLHAVYAKAAQAASVAFPQKEKERRESVQLSSLVAWLEIAARRDEALVPLRKWAVDTSKGWADGITDATFAKISTVVRAGANALDTTLPPPFGDYVRSFAVGLLPPNIMTKEMILDDDGAFRAPQNTEEANESWGNYTDSEIGVPLDSLDAYMRSKGKTTLLDAVEESIIKETSFPRRSAASVMRRYAEPRKVVLAGTEILSVDEYEPYVQASERLPQTIFETLRTAASVDDLHKWTRTNVGVICARQYGRAADMRYVIRTLSTKVRSACQNEPTTIQNADALVYLALAIRVLGRSATMQFTQEGEVEQVRTWVFAAVVSVALQAAKLAAGELGEPAVIDTKKKPARDLNLFFEPSNVKDIRTIAEYNQLCELLYEESMLLYVAPGIEHDVNYRADSDNLLAGAALEGRYCHELAPKTKHDAKRPKRAPYYLGGGLWGGVKASATMHAMKSMIASLIPAVPEGAAVGGARLIGGMTALYASIAIWILWRIYRARSLAASLKTHSMQRQEDYVESMLGCTPYRALNVACAALTVQDTAPMASPSSVMHMLDPNTGYVRIVFDLWAQTAGMDVAPPSAASKYSPLAQVPMFAPERVMPHFSRGHYATATEAKVGQSGFWDAL